METTGNRNASTFTVSATWDEIKDHIGMNKNIQVIAFDDANGDDVWQDWDAVDATTGEYVGENSYWLHDSWMHIDSWGDTTIRVHDHETNTETATRLKKDTDAAVNGLTIMVW